VTGAHRSVELRVDVGDATGLPGAEVAATVWLPETPARDPVVAFAFPGGGYSRRYWSFDVPGSAGADVLGRLASGSLADGFPPLRAPTTVGIGQSMGATSAGDQAPVVVNAERLTGELTLGGAGENPLAWAFHFDDEPADLVARDMGGGELPPWRSATVPSCAALGVAPGNVTTEVAAITVPVFVGVGERDVVPNPWLEPFAYRSATDITVFVCPRMAHMHNFASTRELLWQRVHHWADGVAAIRTTPASDDEHMRGARDR
jgi:hypothetical protein